MVVSDGAGRSHSSVHHPRPANLLFKRSHQDQTSNTQDDINERETEDHEDG